MWFKCDMTAPCLTLTVNEIGEAGAYQVMKAVQNALALNLDIKVIDATWIKSLAGVKIDRARRLLSHVISFLEYTLKIPSKKSDRKVSENSEKSDRNPQENSEKSIGNLLDFTPSNPRGSTRVKSRIETIKSRDNTPLPPKGEDCESENFKTFWNAYPYKANRKKAFEAWQKKKLDSKFDEIMTGLEKLKPSHQWQKNNGEFIPMPTTFLNGSRWNDEPIRVKKNDGMAAGLYVPPHTEYEPMSGCF